MFLKINGKRRQVLISVCIYIGTLGVGYFAAWTGTILPKLKDPDQSPIPYNLTGIELSLVVSFIYVGSLPGPYLTGWLSNTVGRKPCLIGSGVLAIIGTSILACANHLGIIYFGRLIFGCAGGCITVISLVYIGEIGSTDLRGVLLAGIGICQTSGTIMLFALGPFLSFSVTTLAGLALFVIFSIGSLFISESPIFFILKGNDEKVTEVLENLGRLDEAEKLLSIKKEHAEMSFKRDWLELFTIKCNRKAFFIVSVIFILQNCSGFLIVIFFSATIFELAGSSVDANLSMIIIGCFQLAGSTLSMIVIDRAGRRIVLTVSTLVCSLSMLALGVYFYLHSIQSAAVVNLGWLPLLILIIYFIGYDMGFGVVPNVLIGEMFTSNVRSKGSALAMTISWLTGFIVSTTFGVLLEILGGHYMFWFFSCISGCAFFFTIFYIPETKGKSLLEIQELLNN